MKNMNEISIIVPIYNSERYLIRCLNSILNQSLKNIEVICIDDGSTDSSVDIIKNYINIDDRVKLYINKKNKGVAYTRNFGIKKATSNIIGFVDSDDTIEESMFENMTIKMKQENSDIVMCNFNYLDNNGHLIKKYDKLNQNLSKEIIFKRTLYGDLFTGMCNKIYKKELFSINNIKFPLNKIYEDAMVVFKLVYFSKKISISEENFYNYYYNPNSITNTFSKKNFDDTFYKQKITKIFLKKNKIYKIYKEEYIKKLEASIHYLLSKLKKSETTNRNKLKLLKYFWKIFFNNKEIENIHISKVFFWIYTSFLMLRDDDKYLNQLLYSIDYDKQILKEINLLVFKDLGLYFFIIKKLKESKISKVYLYGAGVIAQKLIPEIQKLHITILGIIDSNAKENDDLLGYKINKFGNIDFKSNIIVVASESSAYEITKFLENQSKKFEIINFYSNLETII